MLYISLVAISCAGAYLTHQIRHAGWSWWLVLLPAMLSAVVWSHMAQRAERLGMAAVVFDVLVAGSYLATFWWCGERFTATQAVGAALAVVGCALMAS